jgi:hypothetical protein
MLMQRIDEKMIMNVHQIITQRVVGGFFILINTLHFLFLVYPNFVPKFKNFPDSLPKP